MLAVVLEVPEQCFLVGELVVVLKVVETVLEDAVVNAVLVLVVSVGLLPAQVHEHFLGVYGLLPLAAGRQHSPHQLAVVSASHEETQLLRMGVGLTLVGDGIGATGRRMALVEEGLSALGVTLRMFINL